MENKVIAKEFVEKNYIEIAKAKEIINTVAVVQGDRYEMDFEDVQNAIAETIDMIRKNLFGG